ncbi:MAG: SCO family protein [Pseudorhodoferax sp.]
MTLLHPTRRALLAAAAGAALPARAAAVPDSLLLHRDGRPVRLRSEVWRERRALVNFVFTGCSSFCGVQSAMLAHLQDRLGLRLGPELVLISLSVDPLNDDPPRLAAFAQAFAPGPHWWWLTGRPDTVFATLDALGASPGANPADHGPLWLAGPAGSPRRIVGMPGVEQLERALGGTR